MVYTCLFELKSARPPGVPLWPHINLGCPTKGSSISQGKKETTPSLSPMSFITIIKTSLSILSLSFSLPLFSSFLSLVPWPRVSGIRGWNGPDGASRFLSRLMVSLGIDTHLLLLCVASTRWLATRDLESSFSLSFCTTELHNTRWRTVYLAI